MSSKNILTVASQAIAISRIVPKTYAAAKKPYPKTVKALCDRVEESWFSVLNDYHYLMINPEKSAERIYKHAMAAGLGQIDDFVTYARSLVKSITDILSHVSDASRRKKLETMLGAILAFQKYYDRRFDKEDRYERAFDYSEKLLNPGSLS